MPLVLYQPDDITPLDIDLGTYEAGLQTAAIAAHLWAEDTDAAPVFLSLRTESLTTPNLYLDRGNPPQDERWGRVRVVGYNAAGEAGWSTPLTDWTPIGFAGALVIPRIPSGCAVHLEIAFRPPAAATGSTTYRHRLVAIHSEYSIAEPVAAPGILSGIGDRSRSSILSGLTLSASAPADDLIQVAAGAWIDRGQFRQAVGQTVPLDQLDGNGEALAAGESYIAAVTVAESVELTKSLKAAAPQRPTPLQGALLGWVNVEYDAAASVIEAGDIDTSALVYDRFRLVEDAAGLGLTLHAGQALIPGARVIRPSASPLAVAPSTTSYLYLSTAGGPVVTESPTEPGQWGPLWEITSDATDITGVIDRRRYLEPLDVIRIAGAVPAVGPIGWTAIERRGVLEGIVIHASDNGAGTSGETRFDILRNGVTIYTASATDDQRPALAFDAADLRAAGGYHEEVDVAPGDVLTLEAVDVPVGGSPSRVEALLLVKAL